MHWKKLAAQVQNHLEREEKTESRDSEKLMCFRVVVQSVAIQFAQCDKIIII